jgi:hypothetical protein
MEALLREVVDLRALDHATVTDKGDLVDAKAGFDLGDLCREGLRLLRIAGKDFDRDRLPILVTEEANDHLHLPFFAIAIVAKGGQFVVGPFQVATRDIIQKQVDGLGLGALCKEPILYRSLASRQPIQVLVQCILIKRA